MYFKREPQRTKPGAEMPKAFWLRDEHDQVICFRDHDAAEHFRRMVENSEAFIRVLPSVQPATLQVHLSEFDNNGYVIQLTAPQEVVPNSDIIRLSTKNSHTA